MANFPWEILFAVLGVVVPIAAALYEFVFVGRKRLGYRVQMDTIATDEVHSRYGGVLQQLKQDDNTPLVDPSFVLLRIENNGATDIDTNDYAVLEHDKVGIRVEFPGRRVAGVAVTEFSDEHLRPSFDKDSGFREHDGVIELPKVPMNRGMHYKVLAALERAPTAPPRQAGKPFDPPKVIGGIKGGVGNGGIQETKSHTGTPRPAMVLICFLVAVIVGQLLISLSDTDAPLDCATGTLTLTGSTAFRPVLDEATAAYHKTCPDAAFTIDTQGSGNGLIALDNAGKVNGATTSDLLAFSDGPKSDGFPQLLPRPIAFSLFTLVINKDAGVRDLSLDQIRRLYAGNITNWAEVGGRDEPVRLVSRNDNSGTKNAFQRHVLGGVRELGSTSNDCRVVDPGATSGAQPVVVRCQRDSTNDVLDVVAATPGAIGYSEVGAATAREEVALLFIDGQAATLEAADHGAYPFWETEYAYTYGELAADSLAASFLRYLTNEVGKDIIRAHGNRPCAELANPVLCRPT